MAALCDVLPRLPPQPVRHAGAEHRALPDPARAVEHRQPGREHIRRDDLALALAPEEQERVELGVLEGD